MFEDPYDEVVEQALCRNESPELAIDELVHPERLVEQTNLDAHAKAIADGMFEELLETCFRNLQKEEEYQCS